MATGTRFMKEISDQFLVCKICFEPFKEPKTLVCLHTFCSECLQKQADSSNNRPSRYNVYSRYLPCPLCRKKTEIPSGGIRRLPDNFLLSNLTEVVNKRSRSKVPPCEICHTLRPRTNDACSKCLDCCKLLCKACVQLHMTTKVTQNHSLIDIEGEKDIECKSHPEEIVRFYCEPCDACICVVCAFQEHRDHEVCSFSDGFAKYKAALEALLQQCKERMGDVGSRIQTIDKYETVIKEIRERIRDLAISYISKVRSTEKELLKKIDELFGDDVLQFLQNKNWLQENFENLQSTCSLTEIIMKDKGVEMLLLKREIQNKMSLLLEPNVPPIPNELSTQVQFVPGDVKLGHISVTGSTEINGTENNCHESKCQQTQTENLERKEGFSTMSADMTIKVKDGDVQTDGVTCVSRDTCTERPEVRDKGVLVYLSDSKTKGTMTVKQDTRSLKCQTDRTSIFDQEPMTTCLVTEAVVPSSRIPARGTGVRARPSTSTNVKTNDAEMSMDVACKISTSNDATACVSQAHSLGAKSDRRSQGEKSSPANRWIHSRKIQTTISAVNLDADDTEFVNTVLGGNCGGSAAVPIAANGKPPVEVKDIEMNTIFPVKIIPVTFEKETSPEQVSLRDSTTMTCADVRAMATQTARLHYRDSAVSTDYGGQSSIATSTPKINCVDSQTSMPQVRLESKITWTDKISTTERATCPMCVDTSEKSTSMPLLRCDDIGTQVCPQQNMRSTNTQPVKVSNQECQTRVDNSSAAIMPYRVNTRGRTKCEEKSTGTEGVCLETIGTETSSMPCMHASTETLGFTSSDKETSTPHIHCIDQWTLTPKPQFINTGVSPPRPATIETGVSTNPVITMESSTYTDVVTLRETCTETIVTVTDSETLTERLVQTDAQTYVEIVMEDSETSTEKTEVQETGSMTNDVLFYEKPQSESKETQACIASLTKTQSTSTNIVRFVGREIQTDFAPINCTICEHQALVCEERIEKQFTDNCTMPQIPVTQDVGTMALSVLSFACDVTECGTQTSSVDLYDKSIATSTDWDAFENSLKTEHRDASTSTESLPYIGLLSEIDVDDLIVVPEAQFDLMLDSSCDEEEVEMVDNETSTDIFQCVEAGTQTLITSCSPETSPTLPRHNDPAKHLVSIGVNTASKMTFEKETSTPIRHLFSKGTMTFYISKIDKSTSTFSHTRQLVENKFGGSVGRNIIIPKIRVEDKDTMTFRVEQQDKAVETDTSFLDGKITQCISKLRNVSEKLNSPTPRQSMEGDVFFGKSFLGRHRGSDSSDQSSPSINIDNMTSSREGKISPGSPGGKPEEERQKQIQQLIAETHAILKPKELKPGHEPQATLKHIRQEHSPVRKAQPITTLKGRIPDKNKDMCGFKTRSLPRQFSVEYPPSVRMGSQTSPPSRLPLLRYNSAPGRIATVPIQKLQNMKVSQHQRGASPSKIPVIAPNEPKAGDIYQATQKVSKPTQRPSLPAISETRTPSSCSDTSTSSFVSAASGDSVTPSLTLSNMTLSSDTQTDASIVTRTSDKSSVEISTDSTEDAAKSSCQQQKKSGLGFMQRFLSKKKKDPQTKADPKPPTSSGNKGAKYRVKQAEPEPPKQPPVPKKSRPFVYVRQRIFSIQHDNEDEQKDKKSRNKTKSKKSEKNNGTSTCSQTKENGKKPRDSDSDHSDSHPCQQSKEEEDEKDFAYTKLC